LTISFETFIETELLLCTTICIDCYLQNCWQPNLIHIMLRSRKFWKGRSYSRTFYLRLCNPAC